MTAVGSGDLTATELLARYGTGELDPVFVAEESLDELSTSGQELNAVIALADADTVRAAAMESRERWRHGVPRPLEGVPVGVKDIVATRDLPTTGGSAVLGSSVPLVDATCVRRLREAGAIIVAKLATSEFAAGQPDNLTFGKVRNPWDHDRWTGGSSTGSGAALASRLVPLAIGTDTGGSIRIPSAWCGTTGLKPTYGRVPRTGVLTLSWTLDHVGPMARSARDCGAMLNVIAGADGVDPTASPRAADQVAGSVSKRDLRGMRIGAVGGWFTDICDSDVVSAWRGALDVLADSGATVHEVELPSAGIAFAAGWQILFAEAASLHEGHLERLDDLDPGFAARMLQGRFVLAIDYLRALRLRTVVIDEALDVLDRVDVLCTIGVPGTAPLFSDLLVDIDDEALPMQSVHSRATMFANFTGLPAMMLPSGYGRAGMPLAVQLIGRPFAETTLVEVGAALQDRTDHHQRRPLRVASRR